MCTGAVSHGLGANFKDDLGDLIMRLKVDGISDNTNNSSRNIIPDHKYRKGRNNIMIANFEKRDHNR